MRNAAQLQVAQTIYTRILQARSNIRLGTKLEGMEDIAFIDPAKIRLGWRCREKELVDLAYHLGIVFTKSDSSFVHEDFIRAAIPSGGTI